MKKKNNTVTLLYHKMKGGVSQTSRCFCGVCEGESLFPHRTINKIEPTHMSSSPSTRNCYHGWRKTLQAPDLVNFLSIIYISWCKLERNWFWQLWFKAEIRGKKCCWTFETLKDGRSSVFVLWILAKVYRKLSSLALSIFMETFLSV